MTLYTFRVKAICSAPVGGTQALADLLHSPWSNQSLWDLGALSGVTMPVPAGAPTQITAAQRMTDDNDVTLKE